MVGDKKTHPGEKMDEPKPKVKKIKYIEIIKSEVYRAL